VFSQALQGCEEEARPAAMLTGMQLENIAQQATQGVEKLTTLQGDLTTFTTVYAQTDLPLPLFQHCLLHVGYLL
jgi:hypothetical protein